MVDAQLHDRIGRIDLISHLEQLDGGPTKNIFRSYFGTFNFLLKRYATNEDIYTAQAEITSMTKGPRKYPFYLYASLWTRAFV